MFSIKERKQLILMICKNNIKIEDMVDFIKEFFGFVVERKKYWIIPLILILLLLSIVITLSQGTALAPFIYSIF